MIQAAHIHTSLTRAEPDALEIISVSTSMYRYISRPRPSTRTLSCNTNIDKSFSSLQPLLCQNQVHFICLISTNSLSSHSFRLYVQNNGGWCHTFYPFSHPHPTGLHFTNSHIEQPVIFTYTLFQPHKAFQSYVTPTRARYQWLPKFRYCSIILTHSTTPTHSNTPWD